MEGISKKSESQFQLIKIQARYPSLQLVAAFVVVVADVVAVVAADVVASVVINVALPLNQVLQDVPRVR